MKCMVHVGGTSIASVYDLAEHAEEKGADAVLCLPDLFFKPTCEEDLVDYLLKVSQHCPTKPFFYYHFPAFSRVNCEYDAISFFLQKTRDVLCTQNNNFVSVSMSRFCDLAENAIPTFGGIKFSNSDLNEGAACLKSGRKIFLGSNTVFSGALALGFDSAILVTLNVFPDLAQAVYAAVRENRWDDAKIAQEKLTKRFNESGANLKAEFNRVNSDFACGPARKPLLNLNKQK